MTRDDLFPEKKSKARDNKRTVSEDLASSVSFFPISLRIHSSVASAEFVATSGTTSGILSIFLFLLKLGGGCSVVDLVATRMFFLFGFVAAVEGAPLALEVAVGAVSRERTCLFGVVIEKTRGWV